MSVNDQAPIRLRKRAHRVLVEDRLLLRLGERTAQISPFDDARALTVDLLDAGITSEQLTAKVTSAHGADAADAAILLIDQLDEAGLLERLDVPHGLVPLDVARFDRLLNYLSQSETAQATRFDYLERLRTAKVTVIGTGGLGSWIIYNLLCCGVGTLKLIDGDIVEPSNLNRSILYDESQISQPKVAAACDSVLRFAPRTFVEVRDLEVTSADCLAGELTEQDLVIATADRPPWQIRQWVADACVQAEVPLIHPSGLHVGPLYVPGVGSCPMCEWAYLVDRNPRQAKVLLDQRRVPPGNPGAVSYIGTITAGVVALEAFRLLTGTTTPATLNGIWEMDHQLQAGIRQLPAHPQCGVCGTRTDRYRIPDVGADTPHPLPRSGP